MYLYFICQPLAVKQKGSFSKDKSWSSLIFLLILPNRLGPYGTMAHVKGTCSLTTNEIWLGLLGKWLGSICI
jgi:hypothetical protein